MDCAGGSTEQTEKWQRFAGSDHSRCFESSVLGMSGKACEIVVDDVLGYVLPGSLAVLFEGNGPENGGATSLIKFRPIAGLCAMRKVLGHVWLMSLPPLRYESVQTAFVPKTHADAGLFLLLQTAKLSREWQREKLWLYNWT